MSRDPANGLSVEQYRADLRRLRTDWLVFGGVFLFIAFTALVLHEILVSDGSGDPGLILVGLVLLSYICRLYDENRLLWRVRRE
jgi:hypothetical protein